MLRPQSAHIGSTLRPKYIIKGCMDPLGYFEPISHAACLPTPDMSGHDQQPLALVVARQSEVLMDVGQRQPSKGLAHRNRVKLCCRPFGGGHFIKACASSSSRKERTPPRFLGILGSSRP